VRLPYKASKNGYSQTERRRPLGTSVAIRLTLPEVVGRTEDSPHQSDRTRPLSAVSPDDFLSCPWCFRAASSPIGYFEHRIRGIQMFAERVDVRPDFPLTKFNRTPSAEAASGAANEIGMQTIAEATCIGDQTGNGGA